MTTQPAGFKIRMNSLRAEFGSNQWKAWPAVTKSMLESPTVGGSAEPSMLEKPSVGGEIFFAGLAHLLVGFDAIKCDCRFQETTRRRALCRADAAMTWPGATGRIPRAGRSSTAVG